MYRLRKQLSMTLCLSQIFLLSGFFNPVFSLPATSGAVTEEAQLAGYEKVLFGYARPSGAVENRLEAVERDLFGQVKTGSITGRLADIGKALQNSKSDFLLPPMAPKFDFSQASSSASSKSGASSSGSSSSSSGYSSSDSSSPASEASKQALRNATNLYQQGKMEEAERAFRHVLTLDSKSVDAYFNLGVIAETRGDFNSALNNYQIASRLNPDDSELHDAVTAVQGKIAQKQASDSRAKQQQQQANDMTRNQQQHDNLKQLATDAQSAYKAGNYDKAIQNLTVVARQAPNDPDVAYALSQAYKGKGNLINARVSLDHAISIDPNNKLYQTAMTQLNNRNASANAGSSSLGSRSYNDDTSSKVPYSPYNSSSSSGWQSSSAQGGSQSGWQSMSPGDQNPDQPSGQLTPFTSQGESNLPGGGIRRGGVSGNGFYYGTPGSSTKTRLTRAAIGAGTGLAFGAMFGGMGGGGHRMGRSMMTGALIGGAVGLFSGGW
ncbi:MAG TPA: tetratricopeptide repeat protein [Oculatellaceae cyanobacterium]